MIENLYNFYTTLKLGHHPSFILTTSTVVGLVVVSGICLHKVFTRIFFKRFQLFVLKHYPQTERIAAEIALLRRFLMFLAPLILFLFLPILFGDPEEPLLKKILLSIQKILITYILFLLGVLTNTIINFIELAYNQRPGSQKWPIRSYVQFIKIFTFIIFSILIISHLLDKSPLTFLTGLGAIMAIVTLVFKDSIQSFVSSIQVATSNIMQKGDWIEIPEKDISGHIIEMSLHTIKVQNFDKTISTIPPYYVTSNIIKNWQGMFEFGARRIKIHLTIDNHTVKFLDEPMIASLKKSPSLNSYLAEKHVHLNGHTTNLGLFRRYVEFLLEKDNRFAPNTTYMARIIQPHYIGGVPLEIYAYTKETNWKLHEHIQSELVETLIAIMPQFELKLLQSD